MGRQTPKGDQTAQARFNQLTVIRHSGDVSRALGHSNSRNDRVAQVASFFSLIRNAAPDLATAAVMIEKASVQLFRSPDGNQAAHYLPGQLKVVRGSDAVLPWVFLPGSAARVQLQHLFADVEHLPAAFNKADSAAEDKGLRETFRAVGQRILSDPIPPRKGGINKTLVRKIYEEIWVPGASKAYSDAFAQKSMASEVPPLLRNDDGTLDPANIEARSTADWSRQDEADILVRYREALRTPPASLGDEKMAEIERTVQGS